MSKLTEICCSAIGDDRSLNDAERSCRAFAQAFIHRCQEKTLWENIDLVGLAAAVNEMRAFLKETNEDLSRPAPAPVVPLRIIETTLAAIQEPNRMEYARLFILQEFPADMAGRRVRCIIELVEGE